jgi:membrane AbrB-like protein
VNLSSDWMKLPYHLALLPIMAVLFAFGLQTAHLPAAWLFGPLVASALFAVRDWQAVELPRPVYIAAQAAIGTALGAGFSPATLLMLPNHFSIFAFAVVFILLTSLFNGWLLQRRTRLDVATAFLGTMPGGAGEMAAMSDSLRADSRLVVIMQYTRLLLILASLALVTPFLSHHSASSRVQEAPALLHTPFAWWKMGALCLLAFAGWLTGMRTRIPAGTFLVPTVLYFLLEISGVQLGRWPLSVLAIAYLVMGLQIGGRFSPLYARSDQGHATSCLWNDAVAIGRFLRPGMDSEPRNGSGSGQRLLGCHARWTRFGRSRRGRIARRYRRHPHGPPGAAPVRADCRPMAGSGLLEMAGKTRKFGGSIVRAFLVTDQVPAKAAAQFMSCLYGI